MQTILIFVLVVLLLGGFVYCSRCGYNALEANNYTFCPKW